MTSADLAGQAAATGDLYRALLAVSEVIVSHRDLEALFHALASRLRQVVRFDYLGLYLHQAEDNALRLHVLEPPGTVLPSPLVVPVGETPAKRGEKLPLLGDDDVTADRSYIREFLLARRRALGQKHGVQYAEAFHHIGGGAAGSAVEEYIKKNAVPVR